MPNAPIESDSPACGKHNRAAALVPEIKKAADTLIKAETEVFGRLDHEHLRGLFEPPPQHQADTTDTLVPAQGIDFSALCQCVASSERDA